MVMKEQLFLKMCTWDISYLMSTLPHLDGDLHPKNLFSLYADAVVLRYQVDTT